MNQKTIKNAINGAGIALHSGEKVRLRLRPAAPDTGIQFVRTDLIGRNQAIPARWDHVVDTRLCTVLANDNGASVATVEHLMAAIAGLGIHNLEILVDGPEVPVMDGSAVTWVLLLESAGIVEQDVPVKAIRINKHVRVEEAGKWASLSPGNGFGMDFQIDFDSKVIGYSEGSVDLTPAVFKSDIAPARTFGFLHEVEYMRSQGLAKGGSMKNAVVIGEDAVLNEEGLRFEDEFVRHKMLDAVGDLSLAGAPIQGRFRANKSGHALNNKLLRALFADADAWTLVDASPVTRPGLYEAGNEDLIAATA
ncbi:MAG: UDP-3-O-acyl-N-acetylglucosamine deacetylase [Magnetospiraceae bacterium]